MPTTPQQLGQYIFDANPYTRKKNPADPLPTAMDPLLTDTEKYYVNAQWYFKDGTHHVGRALRIPYHFTDSEGQTVQEYLLVGFEGTGGE